VNGIWQQLRMSLTLYFRNRMAMLYGYLFPSVFLLAFYVLYRYERVPLVRHMGELLTVTILGGACFGMATTLVSERERGVWRRYRLTPIPTGALVVSTVVARYVLLLTAGLLQLALAMALGMPLPDHPLQLAVAFSLAALAFLGLGLVIAMLADNVPAVQALGQTIFLPMLIIGGVAVPLTSLPDWALHLSAYFPGRYAVEAIQATVNGAGLSAVGFSLVALFLIGAAACAAGAGMFRWDAKQRFATSSGKGWLAVALAGWVSVGLLAQWQGRVIPMELAAERAAIASAAAASQPAGPAQSGPATSEPALSPGPSPVADASSAGQTVIAAPVATEPQAPASTTAAATAPRSAPSGAVMPPAAATPSTAPSATAPPPAAPAAPWEKVTIEQVMADLVFDRLPPDAGVVTPIASASQDPPEETWTDLDVMYTGLQTWAPGRVPDVLTRVRNLLFVPAVVDVFQLPTEAYVPAMVFEMLERDIDRDVLIKALYHVAVNPDEGNDAAVDQMAPLGLPNGPSDMQEVRGRLGVYAVKLIGRLTGARPAR
jgi:ABC-type polysaccharide/polyol phosphate export permease